MSRKTMPTISPVELPDVSADDPVTWQAKIDAKNELLFSKSDHTPAELVFLKTHSPFAAEKNSFPFRRYLRQNQQRLKTAAELAATAGTAAEREADAARLETARQEQAARLPELERQRAAIEAEMSALAAAVAGAQSAVQTRQTAIVGLRNPKLLPVQQRAEFDAIQQQWDGKYESRIREIQREIDLSVEMARLDPALQPTSCLAYAVQLCPGAVRQRAIAGYASESAIDPEAWRQYVESRRAGDAARQAAIEAIRAEPAAVELRQQLDALLSFYVPE